MKKNQIFAIIGGYNWNLIKFILVPFSIAYTFFNPATITVDWIMTSLVASATNVSLSNFLIDFQRKWQSSVRTLDGMQFKILTTVILVLLLFMCLNITVPKFSFDTSILIAVFAFITFLNTGTAFILILITGYFLLLWRQQKINNVL